jgi:radical SAM superfamily enzyme YgiQ (UPF0313 family)
MRILLVGPEREENLSLRYLSAALLAGGHEASIAPFDSLNALPSVVEMAAQADAVGLSLCFQVRAREFLALAAALKLLHPHVKIVVGGHYATCAAEDLLTHHPDLDVIVLHEGEAALLELTNVGFDEARFSAIAGLVYRVGPEICRSAPRQKITNLDTLPFPDRRGPVRYLAGVPTAYMMGSRGCYSNCDYCCISTLHRVAPGPKFRQRSVKNIASEMAALYFDRNVRQFIFHDDNFLVPSLEQNHRRLDTLASALRDYGIGHIGFTIKCRPSEVERSVFEKLSRMGLLRVFLGIESGSARGLTAIGRHGCAQGREADLAAGETALKLCRDLGISAQYTIMCFHPDATLETVRSDLAFFRRHLEHPLNFCRVETYAGTPLEARLRAEGRGRGDYLARTYSITDPRIERASVMATRLFQRRCWTNDSLMELTIGLDYLAEVLVHHHASSAALEAQAKVREFETRVNKDLVDTLDELLAIAIEAQSFSDLKFQGRMRDLVRRERVNCGSLIDEGLALRNRVRALGSSKRISTETRKETSRIFGRALNAAAAVTLSAALVGCSETGVSEYAPAPLTDSDNDGLPNQCETEIFGTDPTLSDTDGDGIADGDENSDGGIMTNREEQLEAGDWRCANANDLVSEAAPMPLIDSDNDGLPNQCETEIFGTDPTLSDTDGDGIADGDENSDGGIMTNREEQVAAGDWRCADTNDLVSEAAPMPLIDSDHDGLPNQCETEIFGTDPTLSDTDGNGIADGDENSDGGAMTNREEQVETGDWRCANVSDP